MAHELPPLPYDYDALEPYIGAQTMQVHYHGHHGAYVKNLNAALEKHPELQRKSAAELISDLDGVPEEIRTAVRNNGGGHVNHSMYWRIMKHDGGGKPIGQVASVIEGTFGDFNSFVEKFNDAGLKRFGSGWVWLIRNSAGKFEIITTPNQDNPLMQGHYPVMGNDVWEHAYYLTYGDRRADYMKAWWNTVNWEEINRRLAQASR
jgi:Fe-Mn family superoxide dismutase